MMKYSARLMNIFRRCTTSPVNRRGFLGGLLLGIGAVLSNGVGWARRSYYRVTKFQIRSIEGTQTINPLAWRLKVEGLVDKNLSFSLDDLQKLPKKVQVRDFQCVEGWGLDRQKWEGFHLKELLASIRIKPEAKFITFHARGGQYKDSLSISEALESDTMLAYRLNDRPLPPENGFPLRLVIPRMYGYKGVKWVERIVLTDKQEVGFWEKEGYPVDGSIPRDS
jgi:DMSO/TMAO reductase YedYZ molybdopterin-dependent catalytic subunit